MSTDGRYLEPTAAWCGKLSELIAKLEAARAQDDGDGAYLVTGVVAIDTAADACIVAERARYMVRGDSEPRRLLDLLPAPNATLTRLADA